MTATKRLLRAEVPEHLTWDLTDLFPSHDEWEKAIVEFKNMLPSVTQYKGVIHKTAENLLNCLVNYEKLYVQAIRVATYASLRFSGDSTDAVNQGDMSKIGALTAELSSETSFIKSELLQMETSQIEQFIQDKPELEVYQNFINDILDEKPYALSPETEKVLAQLSEVFQTPYTVYQRSKLSDMQFESIQDEAGNELPMSFALFEDQYEISPDTSIRRKAYESFVKTLKVYKNTFAAAYQGEINKQVTLAKIRNYPSVIDMLLAPQKVTRQMYRNQLDIIFNELAPHMRKYAQLKKEVLGLDKMLFCDLKAPINPEYNPTTTFEEAKETILNALSVMGEEYSEIMRKALNERWVDLADNVGKSTGAFCSSPYGVHPYILITWTDSMRSAFVLAHELGHAGHFYLAGKNQNYLNTRPSTYFVEAPSTLNELLLGQYLMKQADTVEMRRWVIVQLLGTYYHNFVTHLLEGVYQDRVYEWAEKGNPITESVLSKIKGDVLREFWGDTVEVDEGASLTWMRQPHYYMGLYPYTYSAGLTVSTAVSEQIKKEGQVAVDRWLNVLKSGGILKPLELIQQANVDMSNPETIRKAVGFVGSLIDELVESYQ